MNSLLLTVFCLLFCERFRRVEVVPLTVRGRLCLLCVPVVSIAFVWLLFPFGRRSADETTLLLIAGLSVLLLGINLFSFLLYRSISRATAAICRYEDLKRYCRRLDNLIQAENKSRDIIHDYLHDLGNIVALIESGDARGAADYIYRLESRIKEIRAQRYTGNKEVDAILSCKLSQMQAHGFSCKVEGALPTTLPFDFLDVCALLSNALDNAVEACALQRQTGEVIHLRVAYHNGFFKFRLCNPLGDRGARVGYQPGRSRGLPIMREVAEKYQGGLWIAIRDGEFVLTGLLQKPWNSN